MMGAFKSNIDISKAWSWYLSLSERTRQVSLSVLFSTLGVAVLISYLQTEPAATSYAEAEAMISKWKSSRHDENLYTSMQQALKSVPALQKKYEAAIAQRLINTHRLEDAVVMANRALLRVKEEVPLHASYGKISLLIEQEKYQEALEGAVALKERMGTSYLEKEQTGSLLFAYNLLRIAALQQKLKNKPGEKAALEELEAFLKTEHKSAKALIHTFSEDATNLSAYISERMKNLEL